MGDQAAGLRRMVVEGATHAKKGTRTIAITSGKGGVGKTSFSVNLAIALAQLGERVSLLDADLGLANVDILLGLVPEHTLTHVMYGEKRISEVLHEGPYGLKLVAGGSGAQEIANLSEWRLQSFINSLGELEEVSDLVLVDTGAGIHRNVLGFVLAADEVVVLSTPEPTSVADAYQMIKIIISHNPKTPISLLVNHVRNQREAEQVFRRLDMVCQRFIGRPIAFLGYIPTDDSVPQAVKEQKPFILGAPSSAASRQVQAVAQTFAGRPQEESGSSLGQVFLRMRNLFKK